MPIPKSESPSLVKDETIDKIKATLAELNQSVELLNNHPADLAVAIGLIQDDDQIVALFSDLNSEDIATIIPYLGELTTQLLVSKLADNVLIEIILQLESDDAADLLTILDYEDANRLLATIPNIATRSALTKLLAYDKESAGGIMQTELFSANLTSTVGEVIKAYGKREDLYDIHNIFLVDDYNKLVGVVYVGLLLKSPKQTRISELSDDKLLVKANVNMDQEEVATLFKKYDLISLPVIDQAGLLVGRILIDDVVDVLEAEASEDILKMAGASEEALDEGHSLLDMTRYRLPWLSAALATSFAAGTIILQFEATIKEQLALAAFIPIVMSISGNVAAQSSALAIRGIATGKIHIHNLSSYFVKEMKIALLIALFCSILAGIASFLWQSSGSLGVIVSLSIFFAIIASAIIGASAPLFFRWINIDPAIASGPMVLAISDLIGILILFLVASYLLALF
ncbi:MAG: magnesium transporter [Nitrospinota bacterium]